MMPLDVWITEGEDSAVCDDCDWWPAEDAKSVRLAAAQHARSTGHTVHAAVDRGYTYKPSRP